MWTRLLVLVLALVLVVHGEGDRVRYDGHRVLRIYPQNEVQVEALRRVLPNDTDIWSRDGELGIGENDIRAAPEKALEKVLDVIGIKWEIMIGDVQRLIDVETETYNNHTAFAKRQTNWYASYHTYDEILARLQSVASLYSNIATFIPRIGTTAGGRAIFGLKITGATSTNVPTIYFQGGQHAREWIAPHTVMYVTEQLLSQYGTDTTVTSWINNNQFHIIPICNPDGYVYSWSNDRMWRKNRRANSGGTYGVDTNRNWNVNWGGAGSSSTPSSETYRGTAAFSELETQALRDYILALPKRVGGIDFHSYSQLFLRPYGYTTTNCPDEAVLRAAGSEIVSAIQSNGGRVYENIRSIDLYAASGTAGDWFYIPTVGMMFAHTIELRDTGTYGFILPANQIVPTGVETYAGLKIWIARALSNCPASKCP